MILQIVSWFVIELLLDFLFLIYEIFYYQFAIVHTIWYFLVYYEFGAIKICIIINM